MEYKSLYRTWRPQRFADVVGQKNTVTGLANAVREAKLAHAYLFAGPRGTGKTSIAKILAKAANCPNQDDGEPCNRCASCEEINSGAFMDVIEIDAASNRGIDEIRDLRENVKYLPAQGKKKVYIIDEVHMLTTEAFNALLKTLEEPPDSVIFVLATTEQHKIPATVLSRCQRYVFSRLDAGEIQERVIYVAGQSGLTITDEAAVVIARRANGSLRDALGMLEQVASYVGSDIQTVSVNEALGLIDRDALESLLRAVIENEPQALFATLDRMIAQGKEPVQIARDSALCARDLLLYNVLGDKFEPLLLPLAVIQNLCGVRTVSAQNGWSTAVKHLLKLADELRYNENQRFALEIGFIELSGLLGSQENPAQRQERREPTAAAASSGTQERKKERAPRPPAPEKAPNAAPKEQTEDRGWKEILDRVKALKPTTYALLLPAKIIGMEAGALVLGYEKKNQFHRNKVEEKANRDIVKAAIKDVTGRDLELKLVFLEEMVEYPDIVQKAVELFGKDKVEIIEE